MATRLKRLDFERARAKRELDLVVLSMKVPTEGLGWTWTVGPIIRNCPSVAVTIHDTRTGTRLTHPVPLYLTCAAMQEEVLALAKAVRAESEKPADTMKPEKWGWRIGKYDETINKPETW